ncbi:MAG: hypothetical protein ICV60_15790 [Pyrinomonadaceae bacterium]|nr:hypothetical protein [Pyrinomonadaceae bacterium]
MRTFAQKQNQPQQNGPLPAPRTQHTIPHRAITALPHANAGSPELNSRPLTPTMFAHDFSRVRLQSEAGGPGLLTASAPQRSIGPAAGSGDITQRIARLKEHRFLCPPTSDSLTNISKATGGGGTLGYTKIDKSSELKCYPKFDIDAKAGTCTFKPVAPSLSLTSKFAEVTAEAITSDTFQDPGFCDNKAVPIYGKITKDVSELAKQGEQEHCDDLTISFNQTLKPCAAEVNKLAGQTFKAKTEEECFKTLTAKLGFDPISCTEEFINLTAKDDERDAKGMHDFDPTIISKSCTKIVIGYTKSATNKIGDPAVAPTKFIPASTKCAKAATPTKTTTPPAGSGTTAPKKDTTKK